MPDFQDFIPFIDTEGDYSAENIRARMNSNLNQGLQPTDERWVDPSPNGFFHTMTQPVVLELAQAYDELNTLGAAIFLPFTWGEYLDAHAALQGTNRNAAVAASGVVRFTGVIGTIIPAATPVSAVQGDPNIEVPTFETTITAAVGATGVVDVPVRAQEVGSIGNVSAGSLTYMPAPPTGITAATNLQSITTGEDEESDAELKDRLLRRKYGSRSSGNVPSYEQWALEWPGVADVDVRPGWNNVPNAVLVILFAAGGLAVDAPTVAAFQQAIDPVPGKGRGIAPVGHQVTVTTPVIQQIPITASVSLLPGYSLDGAGGTTAVRGEIENAIRAYTDTLKTGEVMVRNHVEAQFFDVAGLVNVNLVSPAADAIPDPAAFPPVMLRATNTISLT